MKSSTVIGGTSEVHYRHESDFYPTPPECTHALLNFIKPPQRNIIWEPAAGTGEMVEVLKKYGYIIAATDLRETGYGVGGIDYLTHIEPFSDTVITNPPFDLSEDFIRRSISLQLNFFAFLLKGQYWHSKNRLKLFNLQKPSFILPLTWRPVFVAERGKSPTMEFMWCVWQKGNENTRYIPLQKPII